MPNPDFIQNETIDYMACMENGHDSMLNNHQKCSENLTNKSFLNTCVENSYAATKDA